MAEKKWAGKVDLKEGALTKQGWPGQVSVGKGADYKTTISRLVYIMNVNKNRNPAMAAKARAQIRRLQREHGKGPMPPRPKR